MRIYIPYRYYLPIYSADNVHVLKMAQAFVQNGHEVTLITPRAKDFSGNLEDIWQQFGIHTPFEIRFIKRFDGLRTHDVALQAAFMICSDKPDLVYTRTLLIGMWTSLLAIPTIVDEHKPLGGLMGALYFRLLLKGRGFRRMVTITQPIARNFQATAAQSLNAQNLLVDPNAIELEHFLNLPEAALARTALSLKQAFTVGYVGYIYQGRGLEQILELAQLLPDVQFLIVGGEPDAIVYWSEQITKLAVTNIELVGFVPNADLPRYYAACDVLLMPYQYEVGIYGAGNSVTYMSPMKMFEYMAARRAIISSDLPVLHEVLNEHNAIFCQADKLDDWYNAIQLVRQDPSSSQARIQQAWQDVQKHTWQKRAERIISGISL